MSYTRTIQCYHVDAFTSRVFAGNPAAVCFLEAWPDDALLQSIAAENNLPETAYVARLAGKYELRWFTPTVEVDLCGHATLAAAYVLMEFIDPALAAVAFHTRRAGELTVTRSGTLLTLNFPARPPERVEDAALLESVAMALGHRPRELWQARDLLAVFDTAADIRNLRPNMAQLAALPTFATIVTAPGTDCDFVSRFFAPAQGIPEDPVTGSAHCTLIPYWAHRLHKQKLHARQLSPRGGELFCEDRRDRVLIAGHAVCYSQATLFL